MALNEAQRLIVLQRQRTNWERAKEEARKGNPLATMCLHCFGRHPPPIDEICPHAPPKAAPLNFS